MSTVSLQQLFSFDDSSAFISDTPQKICAITASYRESIVMLNQYIYFKIVVKTPEKNQNVEIFENNKVKINNQVSVECRNKMAEMSCMYGPWNDQNKL